jgi:chromosome segregation ATPase
LEEAQLQQQQQQHQRWHPINAQHQYSSAPGSWPSYDAAVQHLAAASANGQLPGQFYGRLCNLAAVTDPSAQLAVNAALQERCNMNSMLVVSDRATTAAVIEHFRQNRIGTVNCKILSELQQQRASTYPAAAAAAAGSTPVLELLRYDSQAVPGLQQLMEQLLGGWLLVESREVALRLLHLKRSIVTRCAASKQDQHMVLQLPHPLQMLVLVM